MNLDALIADLEAKFVFDSNQATLSSASAGERAALNDWRQPGNLVVSLATQTISLEHGFVANDFVAGLADPNTPALRCALFSTQAMHRVLVIVPLGSVDRVERRASLAGGFRSSNQVDTRDLRRLSMSQYLRSWLGQPVCIKTRPDLISECTLVATARRFVVVENRGDALLIPVPSIEWLAPLSA